ncbi:CLIP domain-containing serine protease 14D-like isoform X1 [Maniola jurtina]|uniref:CLIP domain-containing serine protease 14D-like isoform X1 n=1 Tax=Maniola jurtina TaxID=191418 RepID=UPI001E68A796|nr:CLIP domain-containing serine protease 14D-like isoform X1 [Maniola jurtina]
MFLLKVLFCVFVLSGSEISFALAERRCFDCVSISSCESGLDFARGIRQGTLPPTSRQTFFDAICGYDANDSRIPKVCCSDFQMSVTTSMRPAPIPHILDPIESHPNVGLLPTSCGSGYNRIENFYCRISRGAVSQLYELPWMTLIQYNYRNAGVFTRCAGSIINSRYILTAAHCVTNGRRLRRIDKVRVGEFDYSKDVDCQTDSCGFDMICESKIQDIDVEEIIPHERFTGLLDGSVEGDIALLRLSEPINMTNNAAPICLPIHSNLRNVHLAGYFGQIAGWGVTENGYESTELLKADVQILTKDDCSYYYNSYESDTMFCAGATMSDTCKGDSGGPLIVESDFNGQIRQFQFGIVSSGLVGCGREFPGIYTDVTKYMSWILDNIRP